MIRDEDAPRPRPGDQPTTCDRGSDGRDDDVPEAVTTKRPSATPLPRQPTTRLAELDRAPGEDLPTRRPEGSEPALLTQMVPAPDESLPDGVVTPMQRPQTMPVDLFTANKERASVSLVNAATWLRSCGSEPLASFVVGIAKALDSHVEQMPAIEYVGAKVAHDLIRCDSPPGEERLGTMLVQIARAVGVDPCTRTMRKIADDNVAKAKTYETLATQSNASDREKLLLRAKELRDHAQALRKATR